MSKKKEAILTTIVGILIIIITTNNNNNQVEAHPLNYPHYHTYIEPATPYYAPTPQLSDDFTLVVRLDLADEDMRYSMPDFYVYAGGETQYIEGEEFEDDAKAKVTFNLDRDDLLYRGNVAQIQSVDDRWNNSAEFDTKNYNSNGVTFKIITN